MKFLLNQRPQMNKSLFEESYANYLFWRHRLMPMAKAVCEKTGDVTVNWDIGVFTLFFKAKKPHTKGYYQVGIMLSPVDVQMMHMEHFKWKIKNALDLLCSGVGKLPFGAERNVI